MICEVDSCFEREGKDDDVREEEHIDHEKDGGAELNHPYHGDREKGNFESNGCESNVAGHDIGSKELLSL